MAYIIDVDKIQLTPGAYTGPWGTQCVALGQLGPAAAGSSNPPGTSSWRRGISVKTAGPMVIARGTVIATFTPAGTYPTASEGSRHMAIYLSHDSFGITVIDQWATKSTPSQRVLSFQGGEPRRAVDKGDEYYVVELNIADEGGATSVYEQTVSNL